MFKINNIYETPKVFEYLEKRWLIKQYKKVKTYILAWIYWKSNLKFRKPKEKWEISFRINKQFRAFWKLDWNDLIIFLIDNHQDY